MVVVRCIHLTKCGWLWLRSGLSHVSGMSSIPEGLSSQDAALAPRHGSTPRSEHPVCVVLVLDVFGKGTPRAGALWAGTGTAFRVPAPPLGMPVVVPHISLFGEGGSCRVWFPGSLESWHALTRPPASQGMLLPQPGSRAQAGVLECARIPVGWQFEAWAGSSSQPSSLLFHPPLKSRACLLQRWGR